MIARAAAIDCYVGRAELGIRRRKRHPAKSGLPRQTPCRVVGDDAGELLLGLRSFSNPVEQPPDRFQKAPEKLLNHPGNRRSCRDRTGTNAQHRDNLPSPRECRWTSQRQVVVENRRRRKLQPRDDRRNTTGTEYGVGATVNDRRTFSVLPARPKKNQQRRSDVAWRTHGLADSPMTADGGGPDDRTKLNCVGDCRKHSERTSRYPRIHHSGDVTACREKLTGIRWTGARPFWQGFAVLPPVPFAEWRGGLRKDPLRHSRGACIPA